MFCHDTSLHACTTQHCVVHKHTRAPFPVAVYSHSSPGSPTSRDGAGHAASQEDGPSGLHNHCNGDRPLELEGPVCFETANSAGGERDQQCCSAVLLSRRHSQPGGMCSHAWACRCSLRMALSTAAGAQQPLAACAPGPHAGGKGVCHICRATEESRGSKAQHFRCWSTRWRWIRSGLIMHRVSALHKPGAAGRCSSEVVVDSICLLGCGGACTAIPCLCGQLQPHSHLQVVPASCGCGVGLQFMLGYALLTVCPNAVRHHPGNDACRTTSSHFG